MRGSFDGLPPSAIASLRSYVPLHGSVFGRFEAHLVEQYLGRHHERSYRNAGPRTRSNHDYTFWSKRGPPNDHPRPFSFDAAHDELWYVRGFSEELSQDHVFIAVYRGGRMYLPLAWLPPSPPPASPALQLPSGDRSAISLEPRAPDDHGAALGRLIKSGAVGDAESASPTSRALFRGARSADPAPAAAIAGAIVRSAADGDLEAAVLRANDTLPPSTSTDSAVIAYLSRTMLDDVSPSGALENYESAVAATRQASDDHPSVECVYRAVETLPPPLCNLRGRVLHRASAQPGREDEFYSHCHHAALCNAAQADVDSTGLGFVDPLTGNSYCAGCSEGSLVHGPSAALQVIAACASGGAPFHAALCEHVLTSVGAAHEGARVRFTHPTSKVWESEGFKKFRSTFRGRSLGFSVVSDRDVDLVSTGMLAGSLAPNVYAILLEHQVDTARHGLATTASFLGTASHNVLDYAYSLYGGAPPLERRQALDVMRTYPAITAAVGIVAYEDMARHLKTPRSRLRRAMATGVTATTACLVRGEQAVVLRPDYVLGGHTAIEFKTQWGRKPLSAGTLLQYKSQALLQCLALGPGCRRAILHVVRVPYTKTPRSLRSTIYEARLEPGSDALAYAHTLAVAGIFNATAGTNTSRRLYTIEPPTGPAGGPSFADWRENVRKSALYQPSTRKAFYRRLGSRLVSPAMAPVDDGWEEAFDTMVRASLAEVPDTDWRE